MCVWVRLHVRACACVDSREFDAHACVRHVVQATLRAEAHKAVEKKFLEDYAWFAHRVRRSIPPPKELEEKLKKVTLAEMQTLTRSCELFAI